MNNRRRLDPGTRHGGTERMDSEEPEVEPREIPAIRWLKKE